MYNCVLMESAENMNVKGVNTPLGLLTYHAPIHGFVKERVHFA